RRGVVMAWTVTRSADERPSLVRVAVCRRPHAAGTPAGADGGAATLRIVRGRGGVDEPPRLGEAHFRIYGKGHVWALEVALCGRCEQLYQAGGEAASCPMPPAMTSNPPAPATRTGRQTPAWTAGPGIVRSMGT